VDSQVVNKGGSAASVKQPLPLPEGVSDKAVGGLSLIGSGEGLTGGMGNEGTESYFLGGTGVAYGSAAGGAGYGRALGAVGARGAAAPKPSAPATPPAAAKQPEKKLALQLQVTAQQGLKDTRPLVARLNALLGQRLGRCTTGPVNLKLRLVLDRAGKITGVVLLAGDRALHGCLQPSLLNVRSPSRPQKATGATVELTIQRS
jgi:hypothetical protein